MLPFTLVINSIHANSECITILMFQQINRSNKLNLYNINKSKQQALHIALPRGEEKASSDKTLPAQIRANVTVNLIILY